MARLSIIEKLRDAAYRAEIEEYVEILKKRGDPKAGFWQAMLDGDEERAWRINDEIFEARDKTPIEEKLKDPAYRAGAERYVEIEQRINPSSAAFWQAMLDGKTEEANNILRQEDLFAINRMLSETQADDVIGQRALSGWKQDLLQKIRE